MKKILHITTDNKFISYALTSFENVYPGQNTVWMFLEGHDGHTSKNHRDLNFSFIDTFIPSFLNKLNEFDLVVLHNFQFTKFPLIALAPKSVKFAWLGWGFDYYDYIYKDERELLFSKTLRLKYKCKNNRFRMASQPQFLIKKILKTTIAFFFEDSALKRINSFSPVIKEDYELVKRTGILKVIPDYVAWNYGSLEENLVQNFIGQRVTGNSILIGNSATFTNNHLEAFDILSKCINFLAEDQKIIVPLSYGDEYYREEVLHAGKACFSDKFIALKNFISIDEYVTLLKQCGYAIMNHKRQQAVGNIVIMIYLGARVFLQEDNPVFKFFKKENAFVNSMEDLALKPILARTPLTELEIEYNLQILNKHWSKEIIDLKTKNLVEYHLCRTS